MTTNANMFPGDRRGSRFSEGFDLPPAYNGDISASADVKRHSQRSLPIMEKQVRICPHQTLTFDRLQRIAGLPGIKDGKHLDAIMPVSTPHHDQKPDNFRECKMRPNNHDGPQSRIWYEYDENSRIPGVGAGVSMCTAWIFRIQKPSEDKRRLSKQDISAYLAQGGIGLCPHTNLNDTWVTSAVYGIIYPGHRYDDPIEQYLADRTEDDDFKQCQRCCTTYLVSHRETLDDEWIVINVLVHRFLGQGKSSDESVWQNQCVDVLTDAKDAAALPHVVETSMRCSLRQGRFKRLFNKVSSIGNLFHKK
ncbi:MAG: hypothetical protein Q9164_007181 [Protoblastenia rupestris]